MTPTIPAEALENHIAILGKTGSGKSNAAKTVVEGLLDRGERVCVLDPTGTWFGLRLTRQGEPSAYPIVIFGGNHADLQIGGAHGAAIAEAVGTTTTSAVIDTRLLSVKDRTRFFTDFAEALLRKNQGALTLVIDEAHLFAPKGKVNDPQSGMMLGAANNLISLGRGIGLRIILISQRPAKVHNDALSSVETLVAMRMLLPHDREAVKDWVKEQADVGQASEILASLPSLPTGDAWIWAPQLNLLERRSFPLASTFDSGKAPAAGVAGPALAPLDLAAVTERLKAVAADVVANDPRVMKARIAELERAAAAAPIAPDPGALAAAEQRGHDNGFEEGREKALRAMATFMGDMSNSVGLAKEACDRTEQLLKAFSAFASTQADQPRPGPAPAALPAPAPAQRQEKPAPPTRQVPSVAAPTARDGGATPTGAQRKVLNALGWWLAFGIEAPTSEQVAFVAGYSASSSTFTNLKGGLRSAGLVEYPAGGLVALTVAGADLAEAPTAEVSRASFHAAVRAKLSGPQVRALDPLIEAYPAAVASSDLAAAAGYSPTSSTWTNLRGSLRSLGFVDYPSQGQVRAADWLFP